MLKVGDTAKDVARNVAVEVLKVTASGMYYVTDGEKNYWLNRYWIAEI